MRKKVLKEIVWTIVCIVLLSVSMIQYKEWLTREAIAEKILRFHVLANSDSENDQSLKLKVRDAVGCYMKEELSEVTDLNECKKIVQRNLHKIETIAGDVISEQGYSYNVKAMLTEAEFPQKTYGKYTFSKGTYEALRVVIGEGKGQNWWCVMYPNLCFFNSVYQVDEKAAEETLKKVLTVKEYQSIMEEKNYTISFKWFDLFH